VQAWHESYPGLVPDAMLEALSVERNTGMWTTILDSGDKVAVHVVEVETSEGDGIVGFGSAGDARDQALGTSGEVTAIYLLDRIKRRGIGRILFASLINALAARGHVSVGLWVLVNNAPTRRFYEALGGRPGPTRIIERSHGELNEIAYRWDDLSRFAEGG
jgi:GNAT superfamily N-acetyltransferase